MSDEEIVRQYADMVYRIAFQYLRNQHDAEDAFGEVFLTYFKKNRSFNDEEHRKAWFIRVTINTAKDHFLSPEYKRSFASETIPETASRSDDMQQFEILDIVSGLKPDYQNVIYLFYYEDMPIKKIADVLGLNENTVKTNLSRAKKEISKVLEAVK